jgi:hypothetical protein
MIIDSRIGYSINNHLSIAGKSTYPQVIDKASSIRRSKWI